MTRHYPDLGSRLVEPSFPSGATNQKHYPDLGSDTSSVWNFCARFSDVISRGNQWWRRKCRLFSQAGCSAVYHRMCFGDQDNHMETAMMELSGRLG